MEQEKGEIKLSDPIMRGPLIGPFLLHAEIVFVFPGLSLRHQISESSCQKTSQCHLDSFSYYIKKRKVSTYHNFNGEELHLVTINY